MKIFGGVKELNWMLAKGTSRYNFNPYQWFKLTGAAKMSRGLFPN